jgi:L-alanine-DL-glutamate epimerase-like enolase superfamily enzyme
VTAITRTAVAAYTIPTDGPEADGTSEWTSTTIVVVELEAGGVSGLGYTYGHKAVATVVADLLFPIV